MESSKYVFEAKTIQRMELLVLSTLGWRMNPVTPNSFFDHIIRRFGLKIHLRWEFLWRCERLLLSVIAGEQTTELSISFILNEFISIKLISNGPKGMHNDNSWH